VKRGQSLLRVNDQPVVLLYGPLPMYRPLAAPVTGNDVEQFEANLRALGYPGFTPDQAYTQATARAVKLWQRDLGLPETGSVAVGQVAYAPGPLRIARHLVRVGGSVPADVLTYSSTTKVVTAAVDSGKSAWAVPGVKVTVALLDGRSVAGRVDMVGAEATPEGSADGGTEGGQVSGSATVPVTVRVADQNALGSVGRGTVQVRYAARQRRNVLSVPVGALLALAEGGYGLEVVGGGTSRIVAVRTGMFACGRVEVRGTAIRAGTTVRMPQ
jgi:peptidoglycan hydrolase-like protein with peptidoglycan-binding domain